MGAALAVRRGRRCAYARGRRASAPSRLTRETQSEAPAGEDMDSVTELETVRGKHLRMAAGSLADGAAPQDPRAAVDSYVNRRFIVWAKHPSSGELIRAEVLRVNVSPRPANAQHVATPSLTCALQVEDTGKGALSTCSHMDIGRSVALCRTAAFGRQKVGVEALGGPLGALLAQGRTARLPAPRPLTSAQESGAQSIIEVESNQQVDEFGATPSTLCESPPDLPQRAERAVHVCLRRFSRYMTFVQTVGSPCFEYEKGTACSRQRRPVVRTDR
jgi:hypothetical protein